MNLHPLLHAASFTPVSLRFPQAWIGHTPLASWIIRQVAPRIFVELGTHSGNSYFAFCQAVAEEGLATECSAVDTWLGDAQAGEYGETVFHEVVAHNRERYARFSRLLRMTFDEALGQFADRSIDLLHIDGLHTYESVRHDFEAWLPKLAPGAVVLLHDTAVREPTFGVWRLWEELTDRYPRSVEFPDFHGLGVLQLNDAPDDRRQDWLDLGRAELDDLRIYFAALGNRQLERFASSEHGGLTDALRQHASNLELELSAREARIADLRQHATNLEREVSARDARIADLRQHATNLEREVSARDARIADLRQHGTNLEREVSSRGAHLADLRQQVSSLELEMSGRAAVIDDLRQQVSGLRQELMDRGAALATLTEGQVARDTLIADLRRHASDLESEVSAQDARLASLVHDLEAIRQSTSWRMSRPIRWAVGKFKGRGNQGG